MKYNDVFLYYRSIIVGFIASIVDISTLFALGHTKLNTNYALIISSFFGILIQFFGQKYWTFKNSTHSKEDLIKQVVQFFSLEIIILLIIVRIYGILSKKIKDIIATYPKSYVKGKFGKYLFKIDNNKIILTPLSEILLKSILVFILYNLVSYPIWHYVIFKTPTKNKK